MTTFKDYVFSKAAATRIFGKKAESVKVDGDRVSVFFDDGLIETTTTAKFKQHFAEHRREQGKKLTPKRNFFTCDWYVNGYTVDVKPDRLDCCCQDWKTQNRIGISRPTCKHCFAVLNKLGCNSLAEYLEGKKIKARESENTATNQTSETTSHNSSSSLAPQLPKINRYKWTWQTYATDRVGNPIKTATTYSNRYPTEKEIIENRKFNHSKGFRLVAIEQEQAVTA